MRTKKVTRKEQRVIDEKAALRSRLHDLFVGASGGYMLDPEMSDSVMQVVDLTGFSRWLRAIRNFIPIHPSESMITDPMKATEYAFALHNLDEFDTFNKATEHLYRFGFRAESKP